MFGVSRKERLTLSHRVSLTDRTISLTVHFYRGQQRRLKGKSLNPTETIIVTEKFKESARVMQHLPVAVGSPTRTRLTLYGPLLKFGQDLTVTLLSMLLLFRMCMIHICRKHTRYQSNSCSE